MFHTRKIRAAILYQPRTPLKIEEVDLEEPREGEVRVKIAAVGLCHTDLHAIQGDLPAPMPVVLGHEGAGIVDEVGSGVTTLQPGDHVILAPASCGRCRQCVTGMPVLCEVFRPLLFQGTLLGGQRRLKKNGKELNHFCLQSSFAEYAVVNQEGAIKIRHDAPLDKLTFLACGASTGIGSVINIARVGAGESVAIFGCGGLGLSAIMAAKLVGAGKIIGVDMLGNKLEAARDLGASHVINSSKEDAVARIIELTEGGADYSFEFVGDEDVVPQAVNAVRPGGKCIIAGATHGTLKIEARALGSRTLIGSRLGFIRPAFDIPRYVGLYMEGNLPLDRLVTRTYSLNEINDAIDDLEKGKVLRGVILP
jgi:S-(hydroxymethyl)glutathione dehydrogenase/alcohol dehydrogenase